MRYAEPLVPGQLFHVYSRGNNRESLFRRAGDYDLFHALMWEHVSPVAEILSYALLPNHFHLIAQLRGAEQLPEAYRDDLSQPFSNWLNAFVRRTNRHRGRVGALFQRPFGRVPIHNPAHRHVLGVYVHVNPQRHGLVSAFREWPYTSLAELTNRAPTRLQRETFLGWYGGRIGFECALRRWEDLQAAIAVLETTVADLGHLAPGDPDLKVRKSTRVQ